MNTRQGVTAAVLAAVTLGAAWLAGAFGGGTEPPATSQQASQGAPQAVAQPGTQAGDAAGESLQAPDALARADAERLRLEAALAEAVAEADRLASVLAERDTADLEANDARLARLEAEIAAQAEEIDRLSAALEAREDELARILDAAKMLGDAPGPLAAAFVAAAPDEAIAAGTVAAPGPTDAAEPDADFDRALAQFKDRPLPRPSPTPAAQPLAQVHFDMGSARLTPGGEMRARAAAEMLGALEVARVRVAGHSDTIGDAAANLRLSRARAQAVADFLVSAGVPLERIEVIARGEDAATLPVPTPAGVAEPLNRSVGIYPGAA